MCEVSLHDACGLDPSSQDILFCGNVVRLAQPVQRVQITVCVVCVCVCVWVCGCACVWECVCVSLCQLIVPILKTSGLSPILHILYCILRLNKARILIVYVLHRV